MCNISLDSRVNKVIFLYNFGILWAQRKKCGHNLLATLLLSRLLLVAFVCEQKPHTILQKFIELLQLIDVSITVQGDYYFVAHNNSRAIKISMIAWTPVCWILFGIQMENEKNLMKIGKFNRRWKSFFFIFIMLSHLMSIQACLKCAMLVRTSFVADQIHRA